MDDDNDYGRSYESLSESEKEQVRRELNGDDIDNTSYYHDFPWDDVTEEDMLRNEEEVMSGKWRSVDVDRDDSARRRERFEQEYDDDDGFDRDDDDRRNTSGGY